MSGRRRSASERAAAYKWLQKAGGGVRPPVNLRRSFADLGYAFLLKGVRADAENATEQTSRRPPSTIPDVPVLFWAFRVMVALGFFFIALFGAGFYLSSRRRCGNSKWFLHVALWSLPLPWVAAGLGRIVAEDGRQPWIIDGVMPTFLGVSSIPASNVWAISIGFLVFYSGLAVVELALMLKYIRLGPETEGHTPSLCPPRPSERRRKP